MFEPAMRHKIIVLILAASLFSTAYSFAGGGQEKPKETITLKYPHWFFSDGGAFGEWLDGAVDTFEKQNPNVHVERIKIPYDKYWDKLETMVGSGDAPDVAAFGPGPFAKFLSAGVLLALNDLIDMNDINKNFSNLQTKEIPAVARDGKTYGLAFDSGFYLPMYRPSVFADAGVQSFATTPDEFVAMTQKLTTKSRFGYAFMDVAGNYTEEFIDLVIWTIGFGGYWADGNGKPTLNSPEVIKAVTYLKKLYDLNASTRDTDKGTYRKMFALGKVGTIIDGMWMYGLSNGWDPATKSDFTVANLPFPTQRVATFYECNAILKATKHPKEAANLIQVISNPEHSKRLVQISQFIPPRISVYTSEFKDQLVKAWPWYKSFLDHANSNLMVLDVPSTMPGELQVKVQKVWGTYFDKVLFDNMDPTEAMNAAQKEATALFD